MRFQMYVVSAFREGGSRTLDTIENALQQRAEKARPDVQAIERAESKTRGQFGTHLDPAPAVSPRVEPRRAGRVAKHNRFLVTPQPAQGTVV